MQLIEPDEHRDFLATLERRGLAEGDFDLQETDTTDPKGDENLGLQGYVTITRLSTQITKEYVIGDESDWLQHFRKDHDAGAFDRLELYHDATRRIWEEVRLTRVADFEDAERMRPDLAVMSPLEGVLAALVCGPPGMAILSTDLRHRVCLLWQQHVLPSASIPATP